MPKKKQLAAAISLSAVLVLAPSAAAAPIPHSNPVTSTVMELAIDPRFDHMSRIASGLTVNTLGRASCSGSFTTYDEFDSTMTITLQQYKNSTWSDIKEWSEDYTGSGFKVIDKGYYVDSGYRYRLTTMVQIWDTDGTELEKVSCDSPISEY